MIERTPESGQVEFKVVVDASRALEFGSALSELALEFNGNVVLGEQEKTEHLSLVESSETPVFNPDMVTEIYETYPDQKVYVATKHDLHRFATGHKFDGTVASHAFNAIMRELRFQHSIQNTNPRKYYTKGPMVVPPAHAKQPLEVDGFRIEHIVELQHELTQTSHVPSFGPRSRELFKQFVQELFTPKD